MNNNYTDDDYCDIYENKICDNCGKCLEAEGVDIRAIKIEDIARDVEENNVLIEEYKTNQKEVSENIHSEIKSDEESLNDAYKKFESANEFNLKDEGYEDAFDHIEYLEEDIFDDATLDDMTEEIFPGVRKIKRN